MTNASVLYDSEILSSGRPSNGLLWHYHLIHLPWYNADVSCELLNYNCKCDVISLTALMLLVG